jgi:hypothetical protein
MDNPTDFVFKLVSDVLGEDVGNSYLEKKKIENP